MVTSTHSKSEEIRVKFNDKSRQCRRCSLSGNERDTIFLFKRNSIHADTRKYAHSIPFSLVGKSGSFSSSHKKASKWDILPPLLHNAKSIFLQNILRWNSCWCVQSLLHAHSFVPFVSIKGCHFPAVCNMYHHHHHHLTNKLSEGFLNRL